MNAIKKTSFPFLSSVPSYTSRLSQDKCSSPQGFLLSKRSWVNLCALTSYASQTVFQFLILGVFWFAQAGPLQAMERKEYRATSGF